MHKFFPDIFCQGAKLSYLCSMNIIIIGAGAAGCFAAIEIKRRLPEAAVTVLERGKKPLAKVAITGGGRCNLTNSFGNIRSLEQVYPRGHRLMKRLLHHFSHEDTYEWFEKEGVRLTTQEDHCVFPMSQDAMEIVNTLTELMRREGVRVVTECAVSAIVPTEEGYDVVTPTRTWHGDKVVIATGGHPKKAGFDMLKALDIDIVSPVPSLFSLCIADKGLTALMGTVVEDAQLSLIGTKMKSEGALLITHWGISGPATLRLSSAAARVMAEREYRGFSVSINWLHGMEQGEITEMLKDFASRNALKKLSSVYPSTLNARLWLHILKRASLNSETRWGELQGKGVNRLVNTLTNDAYEVTGKNRFKEEFVTCGGVALTSLNSKTLEAKNHPGLFFAGEVTDVDAVTGGFNLQAAWTMAMTVAREIG